MGSSGETATAEQMKGEWVDCSNTALRVGQMEQLAANRAAGLSPCAGGAVRICVPTSPLQADGK